MKKYSPQKIEAKWQKRWSKDDKIWAVEDQAESRHVPGEGNKKRKYYCLSMFPYPSGEGLHVGHVESYTATDIYSRYKRMQGFDVLYPMGWDAFGLPAENYAIKTGVHPAKTTAERIAKFKKQMKSLGLSYDWNREIDSSSPDYYRWTQWFFLFLYKRGLAYRAKGKVNWCPNCKTSLANEQVVAGHCERCETEVTQKYLEQWFFRITNYADQLLTDLAEVDWPNSIKETQRNWIGKSTGAEIIFEIKKVGRGKEKLLDANCFSNIEIAAEFKKYPTIAKIKVFTTRPDTLFGATFVALAPDGEVIKKVEKFVRNKAKLKAYQLTASRKNELQRTELNKQKTGVCLDGLVAVNPASNHAMPVWVADYVMGNYGFGAIMAVPAHDERDFEFAFRHGLPIERVIYQENSQLAYLDLSYVRNYKEILPRIQEKFNVNFLTLEKNGFSLSSKISGKPYGIVVELGDEKAVEEYVKIIQPELKKNLWSEIVGGKYISFVFTNEVLKDDSAENVASVKKLLQEGYGLLKKRKKFDPRLALLKNVLEHKNFVPDFIPWTIPVKSWKDLVCYAGKDGHIYNSANLSGMSVERGFEKAVQWLSEKGIGREAVSYRLRDWLVSRQRYWGSPIPIVYCDKCGVVPVPEKDLPIKLPRNVDFMPTGESPLKNLKSFYETKCPRCGGPARREVDTMDTFVCSSWYYYRYCDPDNDKEFASQEKIRRFMPVDLYIGGAEHAVLHLLYSRFFTKVLNDAGYVDFSEPFKKLRNQGIILGPDFNKMSKSKGNVVNPDDIVAQIGADSLRIYEMFMGPLEEMKPWDTKGIQGARRFLEKVWGLQEKMLSSRGAGVVKVEEKLRNKKILHRTIKKVTDDIESLSFNTAISQMMILVNEWKNAAAIPKGDFQKFLRILAPFAPHIAEELWEVLGNSASVFYERWPIANPEFLKSDEITIVIQINGKRRDSISFSSSPAEEEVREKILELPKVRKYLKGKMIRRWVYVPGKIVNIVTN